MIRRGSLVAALLLVSSIAAADDEPAKPTETPAVVEPVPAPAPTPAPTPAPPPQQVTVVVANGLLQRQGISPDLELAGGVRLYHPDSTESRWWTARVRAGVLIYAEPKFLALGIAGQFSSLGSEMLGVEVKGMDLWQGIWLQGDAFFLDHGVGGTTLAASLGYGLFGLEYERRVSGARSGDQTLAFMLNIPLGTIRVVMKAPVGVIDAPTFVK